MSETTTRIIGTLRPVDDPRSDTGVVRMQDRFDTTIDDLWSAITDRARASRWIGELHGDLAPGSTFTARLRSHWEGSARASTRARHRTASWSRCARARKTRPCSRRG